MYILIVYAIVSRCRTDFARTAFISISVKDEKTLFFHMRLLYPRSFFFSTTKTTESIVRSDSLFFQIAIPKQNKTLSNLSVNFASFLSYLSLFNWTKITYLLKEKKAHLHLYWIFNISPVNLLAYTTNITILIRLYFNVKIGGIIITSRIKEHYIYRAT